MIMKRSLLIAAVVLIFCCALGGAFAQSFSSTDLIQRAKELDGQTVAYSGEVIGDVMCRGTHCWVNVNDGSNAIGIWAEEAPARAIAFTGSYSARGDTVAAIGMLHRSCAEHGGDLDIHAVSLEVFKPGHQVSEKISMAKVRFVLILAAITLLLWILSLLKTR
jgi:hypothetical protein